MSNRIQWVNLPEKAFGDDSEQKRKYLLCDEIKDANDMGRTIFIQAEFDSKSASAIATLEVIPDPGNAVFSETEAAGAAATHVQAAIQSDGKAEFAVRLSIAGGDKFKFKAHDASGTIKELSDQFETRRLLYFQVFKIKGTNMGIAGALTHMKNEFANGANAHKHHITLAQLGSEQEVDGPPMVDGSPPGHSLSDYIRSSRDPSKDPYCFSVLFVDQIAEPLEDKSDYPVDVDNDSDLNELPIYSGKGPLWSVGNTPEEQERKPWLKEAYFQEEGPNGRRIKIDPSLIKPQSPDSKGRVFSFLADLSGLPKGAKGRAHFVFLGSDFTNGFSPRGRGFICVAARSCFDSRTESSIIATLMHEAGHKMGMVPVGQSTHYNEKGRHCNHEINRCLMFGIQHPRRSNNFCPVCSESLRKMELDTRGNADFTPP